jgi:hypothetical protein
VYITVAQLRGSSLYYGLFVYSDYGGCGWCNSSHFRKEMYQEKMFVSVVLEREGVGGYLVVSGRRACRCVPVVVAELHLGQDGVRASHCPE